MATPGAARAALSAARVHRAHRVADGQRQPGERAWAAAALPSRSILNRKLSVTDNFLLTILEKHIKYFYAERRFRFS
jgi:hypothetical protein